jgi:hypothetical protein
MPQPLTLPVTCGQATIFFLAVLRFELNTSSLLGMIGILLLKRHSKLFFFCFSYFSDRVSSFCLGPASADDPPPTYASPIAGITNMHQLVCQDKVSPPLCPGWP